MLAGVPRHRFPSGLDRLDLRGDEFQPVEPSLNLGHQTRRERPSIARADSLKTCASVLGERLEIPDTLREEEAPNAVGLLDACLQEYTALPSKAAAVLLGRQRRDHHGANPRLATLVGCEHTDESLAVDLVRLCAALPS